MLKIVPVLLLTFTLVWAQNPESYDFRTAHTECPITVLNQGQCGSCWAFSAIQQLNLRFCRQTNGSFNPLLSPQHLINCDKLDNGCNGGNILSAYEHIEQHGVDKEECTPYTSGLTGKDGNCTNQCSDQKFSYTLSYVTDGNYMKPVVEAERVKEEIMNHGPVSMSFAVYTDFKEFFIHNPKGIYTSKNGTLRGYHSVAVIGWGKEVVGNSSIEYWLVCNSWSSNFGDGGFFKIAFENDVEFGRIAEFGTPSINKPPPNAVPKPIKKNNSVQVGQPIKVSRLDEDVLQAALQMMPDDMVLLDVISATTQVVNGIRYDLRVKAIPKSGNNEPKALRLIGTSDFQNNLVVSKRSQ
ncbi:hypothetical protein AKO1_011717 [Acrasis kona]|uniref:Peptidase C1A papain C-terminal domain-containing protein n=1 Tax=Acrasis kona TaxID=1008807 RepID=A0AAW2Z8M1_9EUKA